MGSQEKPLEMPIQHYNSPSHLLHNFNVKRNSKTTQKPNPPPSQDEAFIIRPRLGDKT